MNLTNRNTNIELLRIISMIMVVFLHLLSGSGLLSQNRTVSFNGAVVWGLESLCFVAVNCYVLISGYFMVNKKFSIKKIIKLWVEIEFYSVIIYLLMSIFSTNPLSLNDFFKSFFPLIFKNYWFPTIYVGLCLLSPYVNIIIDNISKNKYKNLLILNFILFSIWPILLPNCNNLNFGGGYSICWFINLYLISGYLQKYFDVKRFKPITYFIIYIISSIFSALVFALVGYFNIPFLSSDIFLTYNAFNVVIASVSLFLFFLSINIKSKLLNKIIVFISPLTFGVYLLHDNPLIRNILWSNIPLTSIKNNYLIFYILITGIIVFMIGCIIDFLRKLLFKFISKRIKNLNFLKKIDKKIGEQL